MARAGGYGRKKSDEYIGTDRDSYAEAITSAKAMEQDLETWIRDAIAFHAYYCEWLKLQRQYEADELKAQAAMKHTPDKRDYTLTRKPPTITSGPRKGSTGPDRRHTYQHRP